MPIFGGEGGEVRTRRWDLTRQASSHSPMFPCWAKSHSPTLARAWNLSACAEAPHAPRPWRGTAKSQNLIDDGTFPDSWIRNACADVWEEGLRGTEQFLSASWLPKTGSQDPNGSRLAARRDLTNGAEENSRGAEELANMSQRHLSLSLMTT